MLKTYHLTSSLISDCNGDQKMTEVFDKLAKLRKKMKTKRCKVLKANDKVGTADDDEKEVVRLISFIILYSKQNIFSKMMSS